MKACKEYEARISALIDDELSPEERLAVMEHLAGCPGCKAYWEDLLAMGDLLRAEDTHAPEGFADSVMARVKETAQERKVVTFPLWKRLAAIAACCAIAVLGVWMMGGIAPSYMEDSAVNGSAAPEAYSAQDAVKSGEMPAGATDSYGYLPPCDAEPGEPADNAEACDEAEDSAAVITTSGDAAKQWVEEKLGETWVSGKRYTLSKEQYSEVRDLLEKAGEPFSEIEGNESGGSYQLLAE